MGQTIKTVIKLFFLCVIVGATMAWLDVTPEELLNGIVDFVVGIYRWLVGTLGSVVPYALLGAVVVLPIYGAIKLKNYLADRK